MHAHPKQHCPLRWRTHWFSGTWPLEGSAEQERGSLGMSALAHQSYLPQEEFSESLTCSHKHVRDAGRKRKQPGSRGDGGRWRLAITASCSAQQGGGTIAGTTEPQNILSLYGFIHQLLLVAGLLPTWRRTVDVILLQIFPWKLQSCYWAVTLHIWVSRSVHIFRLCIAFWSASIHPSVHPSTHPPIHPYTHTYIKPTAHSSIVYLSFHLPSHPFIHWSTSLVIHPSIH